MKKKLLVLFYSGAGNTQLLSSTIKERLIKDGYEVILFQIKKESEAPNLNDYDLVILASPVYAYRAPFTVLEFIDKLPEGNASFYLIFTKGLILGNAAYEVYKKLTKKGYKIVGFSDIILADTLFLLTAKEGSLLERFYLFPNRILIYKLRHIYHQIIKALFKKQPIKISKKIYSFITATIARGFWRRVKRWSEQFNVNEACNLCGVCVKVCPRNNIKIEEGKVVFGDDCEFCTACIHRCPVNAINVGKITLGKARYSIGRESIIFRKIL